MPLQEEETMTATTPPPAVTWRGGRAEEAFLASLNTEAAWELIQEFSNYVRESGTEDEARAVAAITRRLAAWGVPHTVHRPRLLISLPRGATVSVALADGTTRDLPGTTPAFSIPTGEAGIAAPAVVVQAGHSSSVSTLFTSDLAGATRGLDLAGRVAVVDGLPMPAKVRDLTAAGVAAAIFISPGDRVHESICTPIWGSPDLDTVGALPTLSVAEVNKPDGAWLKEQIAAGAVRAVTVRTLLDTGWREIPIVVAEITGATVPDEFVLVHGHLDSWGEGIGDNATGDATLLELARALQAARDGLARSVRIAWWSGHSHGRYAGSTWYADAFALDLIERCVAQVNCDSPGCRWATEYRDLSCTPDLAAFTGAVIRDVTGLPATGERPPRAGDYSFNNLGLSGTLMLSSTMPQAVADEHGYYAVGGCGGNIAWHTVDDTLEIADRDNLARDIRVYGAVAWRLANAPILPLDLAAAAADIRASLARYAAALGDRFDLAPALDAADALIVLASQADAGTGLTDPARTEARALNRRLLRAGRHLTALNFSQRGPFRQEPALDVPPIPDLAAAARAFAEAPPDSDLHGVALTSLLRARNRATWALREAARELGA
jgi:N-acetylated-alpha-linked acidic dipeptidase